MYTKKKIGSKIDPWLTLDMLLAQDEVWLFNKIFCLPFLKNVFTSWRRFLSIPFQLNSKIISIYHSLSNAFNICQEMHSELQNRCQISVNFMYNWRRLVYARAIRFKPDWFYLVVGWGGRCQSSNFRKSVLNLNLLA